MAYLEYIEVCFALAEKLCRLPATYILKKNVTYNIALKSTTYAKTNVTLDVTLLQRNVTEPLGLRPHRELVQKI